MLSRPLSRLRRATSARRPASARRAAPRIAALVAAALLLAGCASTDSAPPAAGAMKRPAATRATARDLSYVKTSEIRFDGELVGYLVDVQPVPDGVVDQRSFEPGTALIEDGKFEFIGFISPRGTTYRFDADGQPQTVGFGSRNSGIAAFFRRNGDPKLVPVVVGA